MADRVLHVPIFGGGVVLQGAPDTRRTDELGACDGYDIGPRGQLVAASDRSDWVALLDTGTVPAAPSAILAMQEWSIPGLDLVIVVGEGDDGANERYFVWLAERTGATSPLPADHRQIIPPQFHYGFAVLPTPVPAAEGTVVTIATPPGQFKYVPPYWLAGDPMTYTRVAFINFGAREGFDGSNGAGLYVLVYDDNATTVTDIALYPINAFDMLAQGAYGEERANSGVGPGTSGMTAFSFSMLFRAIESYNGHLLGWGQGAVLNAGAALNRRPDNLARLQFSSVESPLVFGNTDVRTVISGAIKDYADTDAVIVGDAGEAIRAAVQWGRKLMIGTNRGLHYMEGYGRDTFLTDRSTAISASENVLGPLAMIVGPDGRLHGVGTNGHWSFSGEQFEQHYQRLWNFEGRSPGWWDLLWTDESLGTTYPGQTNTDLVWMVVDKTTAQIVIGIPWCDATAGYGPGTDTVVVKFHTTTGGYTRQVFAGVQLTAAAYLDRDGAYPSLAVLGTGTAGQVSVQEYRQRATPSESPKLPTALPTVTFGPYAEFGPDGIGMYARGYLTLAWDAGDPAAPSSALPLVFLITPTVDDAPGTAVTLTIGAAAPGAPANGDTWVDTSGTDTNLGNGTAGTIVPASAADYLVKRYVTTWAKWMPVPVGGQQGRRVTVPIAFTPMRGTRLEVECAAVSAAGRWQVEGFATKPVAIRSGQ